MARVPLAVTTSGNPRAAELARARAASDRWKLPYLLRGRKEPLHGLVATGAEALLVFERERVTLADGEQSIAFHEGMAHLRRLRLQTGEGDTMASIAGLQAGDAVLDCTLGLAQDAMVAAQAVGAAGRVTGLEKSLALCVLAAEGLASFDLGPASARVEVLHADAAVLLRDLASGSYDAVLLDPMFESPRRSQPAFEMLRRFAEHAPLTAEVLAQARRVARRCVVVKGARASKDLAKLGLTPHPGSRHSSMIWARVPAL